MDKVLSASKCGFPCERNLYYSINGSEGSTSSKSQRIFDVGTALEPVIVEWLRKDGWNVEYNPGSQNAEIEVDIEVKGGKLRGHPDCIISKPGGLQNVLVDIKTMNERSFTLWKKEGSLKSKPQYVKQLHVYAMGLMKQGRTIEKLAIVGVNKNNSELHFDFFDFDQKIADELVSLSEKLFALDDEPTENSPAEGWCCNYCDFSSKCNLFRVPPMVETDTEFPPAITDSEDVINAMQQLLEARELEKQAKELADGAKAILDANIRQKGLFSMQGGRFVCTVKETSTPRFDSTSFKKAHPDMAQEYMRESVSVTYKVKEY